MNAVSAVLSAIANELAQQAKENLPKLQADERVIKEWYSNGIYYRETRLKDETFQDLYDFRQRKSRRMTVVKRV